jgi:hypothetical protein
MKDYRKSSIPVLVARLSAFIALCHLPAGAQLINASLGGTARDPTRVVILGTIVQTIDAGTNRAITSETASAVWPRINSVNSSSFGIISSRLKTLRQIQWRRKFRSDAQRYARDTRSKPEDADDSIRILHHLVTLDSARPNTVLCSNRKC